jgi:RNA recognition motif-containing protein
VIEWAANLEKVVPGPEDIDKRSIFVGQLNQAEVTKESLVEKFGRYGRIREIQYVARKFFRTSGIAYFNHLTIFNQHYLT